MKPKTQDVERMVAALMATVNSTSRAGRRNDASRLLTLYAIAAAPGGTPKAISETLGVHPSSVTRQIQMLERDRLANVTADPEDGRSCRVALTQSGQREIARLYQVGLQRFASFVAEWDAAEVRELARLLEKLERSKAESNARDAARVSWRAQRKNASENSRNRNRAAAPNPEGHKR